MGCKTRFFNDTQDNEIRVRVCDCRAAISHFDHTPGCTMAVSAGVGSGADFRSGVVCHGASVPAAQVQFSACQGCSKASGRCGSDFSVPLRCRCVYHFAQLVRPASDGLLEYWEPHRCGCDCDFSLLLGTGNNRENNMGSTVPIADNCGLNGADLGICGVLGQGISNGSATLVRLALLGELTAHRGDRICLGVGQIPPVVRAFDHVNISVAYHFRSRIFRQIKYFSGVPFGNLCTVARRVTLFRQP